MNEISFLNLKKKSYMKNKNKILKLINHGISGELISQLNENQLNSLYTRLSEQITTQTMTVQKVGPEGGQIKLDPTKKTLSLSKDPNSPNTFKVTQTESEMTEDDDINLYSDPDHSADGMGMFEIEMTEKFESKAQQKYFWAKCNRSKGKEKEKWCTMAKEFSDKTTKKDYKKMPEKIHPEKKVMVKKEQKEGYMDMVGKAITKANLMNLDKISPSVKWESELEKRISQIVENYLSPKMSKSDLVRLVSETETAPTPVKPKTPTKPEKPTPSTPYKPKHKPAPKAETKEQEPTIAPPKPKTPTKPSRPDTPYKPKPGPKPAPKAGNDEIPSWLSFNKLGIKLK